MKPLPDFASRVSEVAKSGDAIYIMCRSGGRIAIAVNMLAKAGFKNAYNIIDRILNISRIMRIAPETDTAQMKIETTTLAFRGANKSKLIKIAVSQNSRVRSSDIETELACLAYCN
jgi:rhodanese-related sulfurtransferase